MPSRRRSERDEIWRAELNRLGVWAVQKKLDQASVSHGASVHGFVSGAIERRFIEEWLAAREEAEARRQRATLRWARIAGLLAMLGILIGIASLLQTAESRQALRAIATSVAAWLGD